MRIVVVDEKSQALEIDTNHVARPNASATGASHLRQVEPPGLDQLRIRAEPPPAGTRSRFTLRLSAAIVAIGFRCQVGRPAMKTILIPTEDHDCMPAVLETAKLLAQIFDSYMEGLAVRPAVGTYVTVEPVSSLAISGAFDEDTAREAKATFERFMQANAVPAATNGKAVLSWGWPHNEAVDDGALGTYGRVFDLIVVGRPGRDVENPRMPPLEAALFESGKPALIVPKDAPKSIGRHILVAWNGSTEQAHTNAFAMPLLHKAEHVTVLAVEGNTGDGPTAEQAAQHLRRNGISATSVTLKAGSRSAGEIILDQAASLGCDLLVKSAYTQSRIRQLIFGGATRHILANATLPVFMAR
jgi:nucleotide-binding universal stress UspA family protein